MGSLRHSAELTTDHVSAPLPLGGRGERGEVSVTQGNFTSSPRERASLSPKGFFTSGALKLGDCRERSTLTSM